MSDLILHFPDVVARTPKLRVVIYNRVSSHAMAGKGMKKLDEKTDDIAREVLRLAPDTPILGTVRGVEGGRASDPRPGLAEAVAEARKWVTPPVIVTSDISRFVVAGDYHHRENPDAEPTPGEFEKLREITRGVTLATILHPKTPASEKHSLATTRSGKAGRRSGMTHELALRILSSLGGRGFDDRWDTSIAKVASWCGVSKSAVRRLLDSPIPAAVARVPGQKWKDCSNPEAAYRIALERGLLDPTTDPERA